MEMRRILASVGVVALACVFAGGPAWAGDDKEAKGGAREEHHVVIDGLDGELLERAAGELKEHHPAVRVKIKEGVLKLYAEDGAALKKAMHALSELGVPTDVTKFEADAAKVYKKARAPAEMRIMLDGKEHKALPSDKEIEKHIGALEEKLVAAREAGRERQVEELEQALEHMRKTRKELAGMREKHAKQGPEFAELRERLEQAKRALHEAMQDGERRMPKMDMEEADVLELQHFLQRLGGEIGAQRKRPAAPDNLRQRMEHTRQALKHLKQAGLADHAQQVERALHRMEMAAEGEGREPVRPRAFLQRDAQDVRVVEARRVLEPAPAPQRLRAPLPAPRPQDCPPPSVGGFRRGPIHARPPVRAPLPQQAAGGQARVVAPDGEPRPARIVLEGRVQEPAKGQARAMLVLSGEPRLIAVQPAAAPVLVGPHWPKPAMAPLGDMAQTLAQLRAEMAELRKQLDRLVLELREEDDDDDDDDDRRSPRR